MVTTHERATLASIQNVRRSPLVARSLRILFSKFASGHRSRFALAGESRNALPAGWEWKTCVLPKWAMKARVGSGCALASSLCVFAGLVAVADPVRGANESSGPARIERRWIPSASLFTTGFVDGRAARMSSDTSRRTDDDAQGLLWSIGGTLDIASPVFADLPVVLSGGIGSVIYFEAFEREFRLRPTLEWMYSRDTMKTVLGGGEIEGAGPNTNDCAPCRTLFIKTQTEKGYHSLGPGIELEADVGRAGDFLVGFYGTFRAYYLVGDRKPNLRSTGSWTRTDNGQPSTTRADTTFVTRYEREPRHYHFGTGLPVLWSPEE